MYTSRDRDAFNRLNEEALFERALNEISQGQRREGLWLKAMMICDGDESKAKRKYIELLVQAYKDEDHIASRYTDTPPSAPTIPNDPPKTKYNRTPDSPDPDLASISRKIIIFSVLGVIILAIFGVMIPDALNILILAINAICCGAIAASIGKNKWLYGILALIPIVNLFIFLIIFNASNKVFKNNGYKLSFFGGIH